MPEWLQAAGAVALAAVALAGFTLAVWQNGHLHGERRADEGRWDEGWDQGYDRGWAAARDKAIEYGVQALCE